MTGGDASNIRPALVVAADWSANEHKRWMVRAELGSDQRYVLHAPEPVGDVGSLVGRLHSQARGGGVLVGLDCPIGLPRRYAEAVGASSFREFLESLRPQAAHAFYELSTSPTLQQPFYPPSTSQKGEHSRSHHAARLGMPNLSALLRVCERKTQNRGPAECVFWTLGGRQAGRGSIVAWRDVIVPNLDNLFLWPFDGSLGELVEKRKPVIAEVYPAEAYCQLGLSLRTLPGRSKTKRETRLAAVDGLLSAASRLPLVISHAMLSWIESGFTNEDTFDAAVAALAMLQVAVGQRSAHPNALPDSVGIEGWILGQLHGCPEPSADTVAQSS